MRALESELSRVKEEVILQLALLNERDATLLAAELFLARVCLQVAVQRLLGGELELALQNGED